MAAHKSSLDVHQQVQFYVVSVELSLKYHSTNIVKPGELYSV